MVKSPMEYFQEQDFSLPAASGQELTPTERAFLKKYLGIDDASALQGITATEGQTLAGMALNAARNAASRESAAQDQPPSALGQTPPDVPRTAPGVSPDGRDSATVSSAVSQDATPSITPGTPREAVPNEPATANATRAPESQDVSEPEYEPIDDMLRRQEFITLVGFYVASDVFVIPIDVVMEVIHYVEPYKLPMSPGFMNGVVNLRGRILPIINLGDLLVNNYDSTKTPADKRLIIICECRGLQMGLVIDKLQTMLKTSQTEINWNAEAHLGPSAELLSGLFERNEKLLGMISVEKIVDKILE